MRTPRRGQAIAAAWALILAPPLAVVVKLSVYPGWMMFAAFLAGIPLLIGYALQIVIAINGMFAARGVFTREPDAGRGILAAWLTSAGVVLVASLIVDGGDDGTYGSLLTEMLGISSTAGGSDLSMTLVVPAALLWLGGWLWLLVEWIALRARSRPPRAAPRSLG